MQKKNNKVTWKCVLEQIAPWTLREKSRARIIITNTNLVECKKLSGTIQMQIFGHRYEINA